MKRYCARSYGLGAVLLFAPLPSLAQESGQAEPSSSAVLVVRVDDRKTNQLTQPWVSLTYADGTMIDGIALDDGSDPEDGVAGDRLYVCRMQVPTGKKVDVWILDSGPLNSGEILLETQIDLIDGRTQRVSLRPDGPSPGSATSVTPDSLLLPSNAEEEGTPDAPPEDEEEVEENEVDPALGFSREATITPSRPMIRRWHTRDVWSLVVATFLGLILIGNDGRNNQYQLQVRILHCDCI